MEVKIFKSRTGTQGVWNSWEYTALIDAKDTLQEGIKPTPRNPFQDHKSLDSLAEQLAILPDARNLFLAKGDYKDSEGVSLKKSYGADALTQYGTVSDEEIGSLGVLVWKYATQGERK